MAELQAFIKENVSKEDPKIHGLILLGTDKDGKRIYDKTFGVDRVGPNAKPLTKDAVLKVASCTKLLTAIAALQCVERGQIDLDEPVGKVLPELDNPEIVSWDDEIKKTIKLNRAKTQITLRHLLTHTSGLVYEFWNDILPSWRASPEGQRATTSTGAVEKAFTTPLIYEPGQGWSYGPSLDWAGVLVSRLNHMTLGEYFDRYIFTTIGLPTPFPVFNVQKHPEYFDRLMGGGERNKDGGLDPDALLMYNDSGDDFGGHGLSTTSEDYLRVLQDLISTSPKLLGPEIIVAMFTPQLIPESAAHKGLLAAAPFFDVFVHGVNKEARINQGLAGIIIQDDLPEYSQPAGVLTWAGLANTVWFASREKGVAGWFATQISPFTDATAMEAFNAFRKDFWAVANKV